MFVIKLIPWILPFGLGIFLLHRYRSGNAPKPLYFNWKSFFYFPLFALLVLVAQQAVSKMSGKERVSQDNISSGQQLEKTIPLDAEIDPDDLDSIINTDDREAGAKILRRDKDFDYLSEESKPGKREWIDVFALYKDKDGRTIDEEDGAYKVEKVVVYPDSINYYIKNENSQNEFFANLAKRPGSEYIDSTKYREIARRYPPPKKCIKYRHSIFVEYGYKNECDLFKIIVLKIESLKKTSITSSKKTKSDRSDEPERYEDGSIKMEKIKSNKSDELPRNPDGTIDLH